MRGQTDMLFAQATCQCRMSLSLRSQANRGHISEIAKVFTPGRLIKSMSKVAVKLVSNKILDRGSVDRFKREEARVVAKMDHPAIVTVFDAGSTKALCIL